MKFRKIHFGKRMVCLIVIAILCAGSLAWLTIRSYRNPIVTKVTIKSNKVNNPVRYVFIADLHENVFGKNNKQLYDQLKELNPDFILIGGDIINWTSENCEYAVKVIEGLAKISDVYCSLGNHEIEYMINRNEIEYTNKDRDNSSFKLLDKDDDGLIANISNAGGIVLQKTWADIEVRGTKIRIGASYEDMYSLDEGNPDTTMQPGMYSYLTDYQDTDNLKLYMTHRPSSFLLGNGSSLWNIDIVMCGHEHGGQVVLPILGGLFSRERGFFPGYSHGSYLIGNTTMIVTSGLGSDDELLPRFNNPPELVSVTIQ